MKSGKFIDYLEYIFGKKSSHVFEMKGDEVILHHQKIAEYNQVAVKDVTDKCTACDASKYRQDLPFWTGGHKNKPIMIISQDAGKGEEKGEFNTVFTMHQAYLDKEVYVRINRRHTRYLEMLEEMTGGADFYTKIYFTDVIKCAYSTDSRFDSRTCSCRSQILFEIEEVNPKLLVLMGKAAQDRFIEVLKISNSLENLEPDDEFHLSTAVSRSRNGKEIKINASKYNYADKWVFFIPHLNGNLHISREFKQQFDSFRKDCLTAIRRSLQTFESTDAGSVVEGQ